MMTEKLIERQRQALAQFVAATKNADHKAYMKALKNLQKTVKTWKQNTN